MYKLTYPDFAEALYTALLTDPFYITLLQNVDDKKTALIKYMDYSMVEAAEYGVLYIPEAHNYGLSIWSKPLDADAESRRSQQKKNFLKTELGADALDFYNQMVGFMSAQVAELIPANAWYLSIVGIKPEFQGKGLGGQLISPVLKETDALNLPTYLETFTPRNKSFYSRLGYTEAASFTEPLTNAEYCVMVREPRA
jgi:GNAT superfamily N-acetyltransferase